MTMKEKTGLKIPQQVVALYNYNPLEDEIRHNLSDFLTPDVSTQLSFTRGDKFDVLSITLDWWILCSSLKTGKEGYIPTFFLAPLNFVFSNGLEESEHKNVTPCLNKQCFDLTFFPNAPSAIAKRTCPENTANIFSILTFWWLNRIMLDGFRRPLTDADLWELHENNTASSARSKFGFEWIKELDRMKSSPIVEEAVKYEQVQCKKNNLQSSSGEIITEQKQLLAENSNQSSALKDSSPGTLKRNQYKPSVSKSLWRAFGKTFLLSAFFKLWHDIFMFVNPYLLGKIIQFIKSGSEDVKWGYIYAVLLLTSVTFQSIVLHQYFQLASVTGLRIRSALLSAIYRKMLKLSISGRRDFDVGGMVNLMSVDTQKCQDLLTYLNMIWSGPFQILISLGFLYSLMGWSIVAGFVVLILLMPLNICISNIEKKLHSKVMTHKDSRSKLINEMLSGIKVLKLYAWEESFIAKIMGFRNLELKHLRRSMLLKASHSFTQNCAPFVVSVATFSVYVLAGNELTAEKAFVGISLMNVIRFPLFMMPMVISNIMQYIVSVKRISKFLKGDEINLSDVIRKDQTEMLDHAVDIKNATFTWVDPEEPVLKEINLQVPHGSLVAVVGQVGCGKTSLLSSLLGEIHKVDGEVMVNGNIAYVSQQAWIQNKSLRDNILFERHFNEKKYENIIKACSLTLDLSVLPLGDMTEIGEKGINLSGGQKQRVSLARAVYNNADVYLLDDPLSAVDAHVGKHIFDNVIGRNGLLKNKTRILVTNNLSCLPFVDKIIVLKNKNVSEIGTYEELVGNKGDFAEFLRVYHTEDNDKDDYNKKKVVFDGEVNEVRPKNVKDSNKIEDIPEVETIGFDHSAASMDYVDKGVTASSYSLFAGGDGAFAGEIAILEMLERHEEVTKTNQPGNIIQEETTQTGRVKRSVFFTYARSIGGMVTTFVILFSFCAETCLLYSRVWLADWSNQLNVTSDKRDYYLGIYGGLGFGQGLFILMQGFLFAFGTIHSSRILHNNLLQNVLYCSMSFFETTPIGRIVNRLSKDINVIDEQLPQSLKSFIVTFTSMLGTLVIISYSTPIFMAVLVPIAVIYVMTQRFYVASSRQLKRIESVKRSPIYNHFFESINGASTIRAYQYVDKFINENEVRIDNDQAAYFPAMTANRWLAMRLEFCGNLITFFAALFAVVQKDRISAGLAGLSISYALQVTQTLNWMVRMTSELETNIVSVERVKEYIDQPNEAPAVIPETRPEETWPDKGAVTFDSYSVRYRPDLDLVLKELTYNIAPSEKIGIVGRTGAGKSSMALALFRILEASNGKIVIDGVDISTIGLRDLRSKLTIIPQDPVLFSGTLRFNLDPFDAFDDPSIWKALEIAKLKPFVSNLPNSLNYVVEEGGENLSVGQRQLVCLTRAILRKSKILLLDEATAAVDMETDSFIQQTIRKEFKTCTILTIAHRLNTIMDYDRVMVLSKGLIVEFDSPAKLLIQKGGIFYSMVKDAGLLSIGSKST